MFEARFQSFEDPTRSATGPRVAALRAELARRGLTGFILPRADRHQNEYVPPSEERARLAHRLYRLGRRRRGAGRPRGAVHRRPLHIAGAQQVDTAIFTFAHLVETPAATWLEANLPAGSKLGYDPWLHTVEGAERLAQACAAAGATLVPDRTQSDRRDSGPTGRRRRAARSCCMTSASPARRPPPNSRASQPRSARAKPMRLSCPTRTRSPGPSTFAASDVAHTPLPLAFAIMPRDGRPALYVDGAQAQQRGAPRTCGNRRHPRARRFRARSRGARRARNAPCGFDQATARRRARTAS